MGCNAIRLAHNPHAKAVLDMCDEMGILVFADCFDKWDTPTWNHYGPNISFDNYWRKRFRVVFEKRQKSSQYLYLERGK